MAAASPARRLGVRKRPTQARSGAMVEAILQAAAELLDSGQPDRYTTNEIAARAGASIGSLYQYFPSKDAITVALIGQASVRLLAELEQATLLDDWRAALGAMVRSAVRHQLERPALARQLDANESRLAALATQLQDQQRIQQVLAEVLQRMPALADAQTVGADLMAITRAVCDTAGQHGDIDTAALERRVERAVFGYLEWPGAGR